jgi:hypothetical protein
MQYPYPMPIRLNPQLNFSLEIQKLELNPEALAAAGEAATPGKGARPVEKPAEIASELYQWQANAQGRQKFGNQQMIKPLAEEDYQKHVKPLLREGCADSLAEYQKLHPEHTHISLIKKSDYEKLIPGIPFTGSLDQLRPQPGSRAIANGWVKKVSSFDSPEVQEHGAAVDNGAFPRVAHIRLPSANVG